MSLMDAPDDGARWQDRLWRSAYRAAYRAQLAWWFVRRPRIEGAYVAVWWEGRVLAIRNSYRRKLSLPAGGLARGEAPVEAARRELHEEVGIHVSPDALRPAGQFVNRDGYAEDHAHVFELHCDAEPAVRVDGREVVWAAFLAPDELVRRGAVRVVRDYLAQRG